MEILPDEFQNQLVDLQNQVNDLRSLVSKNTFSNLQIIETPVQINSTLNNLSGTIINSDGNLIKDVVNANLNTATSQILSPYTFGSVGALQMITDVNNGIWISPTGVLAKKSGNPTFSLSITGDATFAGTLTATSGTFGTVTIATGGSISSGKTTFADSTNAGYFISNDGIYLGSAADANYLKYTIGTGVLNLVGTISGRSTATVALAIDTSGHFVDAALSTASKQILDTFTFGASGAIAVNTDANNGLWISPTGILGKKASVNTFSIGIDGTANFAGTLTAAAGTLGTITAGTLTGCTFQTDTPATSGLKFDATSFRAYDANGNKTFEAVAATGNVNITGIVNSQVQLTAGEPLVAGQAVYIENSATEDVSSVGAESGDGTEEFGTNSKQQLAMSFIVPGTGTYAFSKLGLAITKLNSPLDSIYVDIQTDNAGVPSGSNVIEATFHPTSNYTIAYNPTLTAGTKYWIVLKRTDALDNNNRYQTGYTTTNKFPSNVTFSSYYIYDGATWNNVAGKYFNFYLYFTTAEGKVYRTDALASTQTNQFIGFCMTDIGVGQSASIQITGFSTAFTGLTIASPYYIQNSDAGSGGRYSGYNRGAIGTGAGSTSKKVGLALSTTNLLINYSV